MKRYYKLTDGKKVFFWEPLISNGMQVFNPTEDMLIEAGWTEYVPQAAEPTEEEKLQTAINAKIAEIEAYDESSEVNQCLINYEGATIPYWADKSERTALKQAVEDCVAVGLDTYRLDLREYGVSVEVSCELMLAMLRQLEVYAIRCYNKTTDHIYAVKALMDVEDVEGYDHTQGYPEKLTFNL